MAGGLAYSVASTQPVGSAPPHPDAANDMIEVLARLRRDPALGRRRFVSSGFSARFAEVAADPGFLGHLAGQTAETCDLGALASTAHALYRSSGDFFALHTMTATHAARLVAEHLSDEGVKAALTVGLTRAVAVAYVVIGAPELTVQPYVGAPPAWDAIVAVARESDDPHVLKMVHTCRSEQAAWGDSDYQHTAATVMN